MVSELRAAEARPGFFLARWRGLVPLDRLFWRDMLLIGTGINAATSAAALVLLGMKMPLAAALAVHFSPVPYNVFLFLAVWKTVAAQPGPIAALAQIFAAVWLILATVI
jgi:hypothetical protein